MENSLSVCIRTEKEDEHTRQLCNKGEHSQHGKMVHIMEKRNSRTVYAKVAKKFTENNIRG